MTSRDIRVIVRELRRQRLGHRRERYDDPAQLKLGFGDDPAVQDGLADAAAQAEEVIKEYTVKRKIKAPTTTLQRTASAPPASL